MRELELTILPGDGTGRLQLRPRQAVGSVRAYLLRRRHDRSGRGAQADGGSGSSDQAQTHLASPQTPTGDQAL
ncbi:hypothetical protein ACLOJK_030113 [Asimina triloba]